MDIPSKPTAAPPPPPPPFFHIPKPRYSIFNSLRQVGPSCSHHSSTPPGLAASTGIQPLIWPTNGSTALCWRTRRWCAAGSAGSAVYVASGVGSHYRPDVAKMGEKWDLNKKEKDWKWEKMEDLKNGRFSREAVEAVGHKGKLCMVNVKGNAVKEGAVYDVEKNRWGKMKEGMLYGWNGPTGAAAEEDLYAVDELKGGLRKYDEEKDCWEELIHEASEELKGAEQMAVGRGRVCVVCAEGRRSRWWMWPVKVCFVDPPPGMGVIAVHILPRMCLPEK